MQLKSGMGPGFITNRIDLVFTFVVLALSLWVLLDTRRCVRILTGAKALSAGMVIFFQITAGMMVAGSLAAILGFVIQRLR